MGLREYQRKRDFQRTPEPAGGLDAAPPVGRYVIQKHDARRLHYDLRLELDGVLLSWALPKGPSLDPKEKRLAVQTEDHPLEYGDFEGVIPEGQYGGGTVMLWDRGTWRCLDDARRSYREGTIKFEIAGQKLRGAWTLVRMTGPRNADGKNWLLIKERDAAARPEQEYSVTDAEPFSVASNRTIREIAQDRQRIWTTDGARGPAEERWRRSPGLHGPADLNIAAAPGARSAPQPATLRAVRPVVAERVPGGDGWLHELKLSGARVLAFLRSDEVRLLDEQGADCTRAWPEVARAVGRLPVQSAILDGLLVVTDARGAPDARALAAAAQSGRQDLVQYHAFDLPFCGGFDLRRVALSERKRCCTGSSRPGRRRPRRCVTAITSSATATRSLPRRRGWARRGSCRSAPPARIPARRRKPGRSSIARRREGPKPRRRWPPGRRSGGLPRWRSSRGRRFAACG